jgi:hypothetical protein
MDSLQQAGRWLDKLRYADEGKGRQETEEENKGGVEMLRVKKWLDDRGYKNGISPTQFMAALDATKVSFNIIVLSTGERLMTTDDVRDIIHPRDSGSMVKLNNVYLGVMKFMPVVYINPMCVSLITKEGDAGDTARAIV